MTFLKWIAVFGMCMLITQLAYADDSMDEDDDDDGLVENEPDENIVMEKMRYEPPQLSGRPFFAETFDDESRFKQRWTSSQAKKDGADENIAKYDGKWSHEEPKESALEGDMALVLKSKAKHHAVSAKLDRPFEFNGNPFIVSYEVKFQNGIECGGAYIKLLSKSNKVDLKAFHDKTPYTVMFGPDKCGLDYKMHFIFRHKNPKTGEFEEKHAKKPSGSIDKYFTDKKTHLYSLVINPDNSFEVLIDNKVINAGNLLEDMSPAVNPPKEIDDPNDSKPEEWDEREKIPDPEAIKPEDWDEDQPAEIADEDAVKPDGWLDDEEALIPDPDADKPEDWDEEMDGEWEAPLIDNAVCKEAPGCGEWVRPSKPNPLFKGKWKAPLIENPNYKGEWKPQRITNPDWFEDLEPYRMTSIDSLGLELWSMTDEILFDNFMITDDKEVHASWVEQTWERKTLAESQSASGHGAFVQGILDVTKERPWLWAVFLIVIVLPIVLVIAYCCMPSKEVKTEQGIWSTLMSAAELRPWLWAVYLVVLLLPIMLLSICLCPRSGPVKPEDIDAARKKTDEPSPDDEGQSGETETAEAAEEEVGASGDKGAKKGKKSKAALEKEEGGATGEESNGEGTEEEELDAEEDEEEEETKAEKTTGSPRRSPRKRKSRKE